MDEKHEQRMSEIYQREADYRQHGKVDIAATHDDIDYLWTRLRMLETAHKLPAPASVPDASSGGEA